MEAANYPRSSSSTQDEAVIHAAVAEGKGKGREGKDPAPTSHLEHMA